MSVNTPEHKAKEIKYHQDKIADIKASKAEYEAKCIARRDHRVAEMQRNKQIHMERWDKKIADEKTQCDLMLAKSELKYGQGIKEHESSIARINNGHRA